MRRRQDRGKIVTDNAEYLDVSDCVFDVVPEGIPLHYDSILLADDLSFAIDANGILVANLSDVRGPLVGKTITLTVKVDMFLVMEIYLKETF